MIAARVRLIVAAALFALWMGWLGYLAATATNPIVLSRPQFLVADAWVIARVAGQEHPEPIVTVEKVIWTADAKDRLAAGEKITLPDLAIVGVRQHWEGAGTYILPLTHVKGRDYRITPIPRSPGFPPFRHRQASEESARDELLRRLPIYPVTPRTLEQLDQLEKPSGSPGGRA